MNEKATPVETPIFNSLASDLSNSLEQSRELAGRILTIIGLIKYSDNIKEPGQTPTANVPGCFVTDLADLANGFRSHVEVLERINKELSSLIN